MEKAQGDPKKVSDKDILVNDEYKETFLDFLRTVRKEPILDMSGKQLLRRRTRRKDSSCTTTNLNP